MDFSYTLWGECDRPWGYEIRVDFTDSLGNIFNECLVFSEIPSQDEIESAVNRKLTSLQLMVGGN